MRSKDEVLLEQAMQEIREATQHLLGRPIRDDEWGDHLQRIQDYAHVALQSFLCRHPEIDFPIEPLVRREEGTNNVIVRLRTPPKKEMLN